MTRAPIAFRGGKLSAQPARPHLRLGSYLTAELPAPPATIDWLSGVADWPMYGNDTIGDCTAAAVGHSVEQFTRYGSGTTVEVSDADVIGLYSAVTGYNPDDPSSDTGAYCQDVLNYWRKNGIGGGHQIVAFASVDVGNPTEVKQAINLFGEVYLGFNFPASAMDQFNAGKPWDVVKGSRIEGGHCVIVGGYDATYLAAVTWGATQLMTPAFWAKYVDEAYVIITRDWVDQQTGNDAAGINLYALGQDFATLTGQANPIPAPQPQPTPTPTPTPTPGDIKALAADIRKVLTDYGV